VIKNRLNNYLIPLKNGRLTYINPKLYTKCPFEKPIYLPFRKAMCIYINKDGSPSTKNTRHVEANVNTRKKNQNNQNSSNEVEDLVLKNHLLPQIS
jgi:hypothetical protein